MLTPLADWRATGGVCSASQDPHDLHDAWRVHHPALTDFTHTGTGGFSSARLDRWLLSADVMEWVRACEILHGLPGDHCAVSVRLQAPQGVLRGPGCWRMPLGVLDDPDFINLVRARLFEFRMQHPVHDPQAATAPTSSPANTSPLPPASAFFFFFFFFEGKPALYYTGGCNTGSGKLTARVTAELD